MEKIEKYSEFEYKKVLRVLKLLKKEIIFERKKKIPKGFSDRALYYMEIQTFQKGNQIHPFGNLSLSENFRDKNCFPLIYCPFYAGSKGDPPLFAFEMSQTKCAINADFGAFDHDMEKEKFKSILPIEEIENPIWEEVLAGYIAKIKIVVQNSLQLYEK